MQKFILLLTLTLVENPVSKPKQLTQEDIKNEIRETEISRLNALLNLELSLANKLHADHFELITPYGAQLNKEQYLGAIESRDLNYQKWEPCSEIEVVLYSDNAAVIRYQSTLEIVAFGQSIPALKYWHTDTYEKNSDGQWQVVWSHATQIQQ